MGCEKLIDTRDKVVGYICTFVEDQGSFLMWKWETHRHLGVSWWIKYPVFRWKQYKEYLQKRRKHFSLWTVLKEEIICGCFDWFGIEEKEILLHRDNPLWSWFYFQKWYREKIKK